MDPSTASYWYLLGAFYKSGFGTKINEKKAFECYKKANELDLSNAEYWYELAICYVGGYGTEVDRVKAFFNCLVFLSLNIHQPTKNVNVFNYFWIFYSILFNFLLH